MDNAGNVAVYKANVKKLIQFVTKISLYFCSARKITLKCQESFWGRLDTIQKSKKETDVRVPMSQCSKAVANNFTPYGVLHQKGTNVWQKKRT